MHSSIQKNVESRTLVLGISLGGICSRKSLIIQVLLQRSRKNCLDELEDEGSTSECKAAWLRRELRLNWMPTTFVRKPNRSCSIKHPLPSVYTLLLYSGLAFCFSLAGPCLGIRNFL